MNKDHIFNFNNKGSALIITMLVIITISIFGLALLSAAANNFIMTNAYEDLNKAYNESENINRSLQSGLQKILEQGQVYAVDRVKDKLEDLINQCKYSGDDGVEYIDEAQLNNKIFTLYSTRYIDYIVSGSGLYDFRGLMNEIVSNSLESSMKYKIENCSVVKKGPQEIEITATAVCSINRIIKKCRVVFGIEVTKEQIIVSKRYINEGYSKLVHLDVKSQYVNSITIKDWKEVN